MNRIFPGSGYVEEPKAGVKMSLFCCTHGALKNLESMIDFGPYFWTIVQYFLDDSTRILLYRVEYLSTRQVDMDSNALVAGTIDYLMLLFFQILFHQALGLGIWPLPVAPLHTSSILVFIISLPALAAPLLLCLCILLSNSLLFWKLFFFFLSPLSSTLLLTYLSFKIDCFSLSN